MKHSSHHSVRNQPPRRRRLQKAKVMDSVKSQLAEAAKAVLAAIHSRFPSSKTLDAHALAYTDLWSTEGLKVDDPAMQQRIKKIGELYCSNVDIAPTSPPFVGVTAQAPLSMAKLAG